MKDVTIRIVRSDGEEMTLGCNADWIIPSDGLEGWATLPLDVQSEEAANLDGGFIRGVRVGSADRSIHAKIVDAAYNEQWRPRLIRFFSPRFSYEVHISYQGLKRWCRGVQAGFKVSEGNVYEPIEFDWTILCTQPFLLSEDDFGKDLAGITGKFGFPMVSMLPTGTVVDGHTQPKTVTGFVVGVYDFGQSADIVNDGDVETQFKAVIEATGNVANPKIEKDGKFVRVVTNMTDGQKLEIDFEHRPPTVTLDGKNVLHLCDRTSNFTAMDLQLGSNKIRYDADDGQQNMRVALYWRRKFLGV